MYPSLWGYIDSALSPRWQEAMICRAKSAPLSIHLAYCHSDVKFVAQHAFHIHELRLLGLRQTDLIQQLLTSPAPILEHLSLQSPAHTTVILPADIFAGNTPSLHHIALDGVLFLWSASIFRNLTYLRVDPSHGSGTSINLRHESDTALQYDHLFGALARMPPLQTLDLAYCLPSRSHSQHPIGHTHTALPCLELLSLAGTLIECVDVANYLRIPSSSRVILKCTGAPQRTDPGLVCFLETYISGGVALRLLTLSISLSKNYANQSESVNIKLWHMRSPSDALPSFAPDQQPFISISFPVSWHSWDLVNEICSVLPLEDLHILKVVYDHNKWSPKAWINILGRCRLLEHVYIQGENVVHFCRLLARPVSGAAGTATVAVDLFFRHLKSLKVHDVDLLASVEHEGVRRPFNDFLGVWLSTHMELFMDKFKDANGDEYDGKSDEECEGLCFEHSKLERLMISQSSITEEAVGEFEDCIQNVVWDDDEGIYKEESKEGSVGGYYMY
ncbi:hypothetical protein EWM64_g9789 [Hericium alpestre]|uniref:F-box domain-containing protein n=1 Tax=Hericium alpestre TaxID=135208 RepID=A0A4Y9ZK02_9AGAM|nr:hypothetical protein EWM64_g9789 [Hericium alpestre]